MLSWTNVVFCIHVSRHGSEDTLTNRNVVSVHTRPDVAERLDALALVTRRSKSFLANEAIERYLAEEESFVASVNQGISDANAGRFFATAQARKRIEDYISGQVQISKPT